MVKKAERGKEGTFKRDKGVKVEIVIMIMNNISCVDVITVNYSMLF